MERATRFGISAALLSRIAPVSSTANENLVDSSPLAPNESHITKERIEYLKSKPYQNTTINVMVLRAAVGDCVEYHAPRWEEQTAPMLTLPRFQSIRSISRYFPI